MGLNDYPQPSWQSQQPNVGVPPLGPAASPVAPSECKAGGEEQKQKDICEQKLLLRKVAQQQSDQNDGITSHMPPPWAIWLYPEPTGPVTISGSGQGGPTWTVVVTQTIPEGYYGSVEFLRQVVIPETANNDITWQVRVDNRPVNYADNIIPNYNTYYNHTKYRVAVMQRQTIALYAVNNAAADLLVVGGIIMWIAPMRKY